MMKEEFEARVGEVTASDYAIIEKVYTWHPSISETDGKKEIAEIYEKYGMCVIRGMEEVADYMKKLDDERRELERRQALLNKRKEMLRNGDTSLEKMIVKVSEEHDRAEYADDFSKAIAALRKNDSEYLVDNALEILNLN